MTKIKVGVFGAAGRMGATVCRAVVDDPDLELVAAVDPLHAGIDLHQLGVPQSGHVARSAEALKDAGAEVAVDFTVVDAARENIDWCAANAVHAVVGTTGFSPDDLERFEREFAAAGANIVLCPNFAIGAVLMMRFAELAAPYFETAEVIELHHDQKVDAPSGTAMLTLERMAAASEEWAPDPTTKTVIEGAPAGGAGPADIRVHSVRLRGLVAHQEVLLGTTGQSLSIRHDSYDRTSFMPGVLLAIRAVRERAGLTVGLDTLLGFERPTGGPDAVMSMEARTKVLAGAYECIAAAGTTRPTIDEIALASGVSRASIYRWFPGGRDEVIQAAVGWEVDNFFVRLAAKLGEQPDFPSYLERALPQARHDLLDHAVLHRMLATEPEQVSTLLAFQQEHMVDLVGLAFRPRLERDRAAGLLRPGVDPAATSDYVARLALSLLAEPGRHDLDDPVEVRRLVRRELLGGVYTD